MRICKIEGCGKKHLAKGYCSKHYKQIEKHGHILPERHFPDKCTIGGCNNEHYSKGFCNKHYNQIRNHSHIPQRHRRTPNEIIIEGDIAKIVLYNRYCEVIAHALIDVEDAERVRGMKWNLTNRGYAKCWKLKTYLHRYLLDAPEDKSVDHINGHPLDNRKQNLRLASHQENLCNRTSLASNNTSGVTGVYWRSDRNKWAAKIVVNGKDIHLGLFASFEESVAVRKQAEKDYFGEFAPKI